MENNKLPRLDLEELQARCIAFPGVILNENDFTHTANRCGNFLMCSGTIFSDVRNVLPFKCTHEDKVHNLSREKQELVLEEIKKQAAHYHVDEPINLIMYKEEHAPLCEHNENDIVVSLSELGITPHLAEPTPICEVTPIYHGATSSVTDKNDRELFNEHYKKLEFEPNKVIKNWVEVNGLVGYAAYTYGQVLKYLSRLGLKDGELKDTKKALYYLEQLKEQLEEQIEESNEDE